MRQRGTLLLMTALRRNRRSVITMMKKMNNLGTTEKLMRKGLCGQWRGKRSKNRKNTTKLKKKRESKRERRLKISN
jgi:hypothetical protein